MNLILFESAAPLQRLRLTDERAIHVVSVLKRKQGNVFEAGVVGGLRGIAAVQHISDSELVLSLELKHVPEACAEVDLIVGLPRPPSARKILAELTALGCRSIQFVDTEMCDPNYARSKLWITAEWRRHLIAGAQQAFTTLIPQVSWGQSLTTAVASLGGHGDRVALDNYESDRRLGRFAVALPIVVAIGPERGWSPRDRAVLRKGGFVMAHLGRRVLRVETACTAAVAIILGLGDGTP